MRGDPPRDGSGNNGARHYHNRYPKKIGLSDLVRVVEHGHHPETEQDRLHHHKDHNSKRETDFCVLCHRNSFREYLPQDPPRGRRQGWRDSLLRPLATPGLGTHYLCLWLIPAAKKTTPHHGEGSPRYRGGDQQGEGPGFRETVAAADGAEAYAYPQPGEWSRTHRNTSLYQTFAY
jgi:hypothetical protein